MSDTEIKTHDELEAERNEQIVQRRSKLEQLRVAGTAYVNGFERDALAQQLLCDYGDLDNDTFAAKPIRVKVAGRIMTRRIMGKASFVHIKDMSGRLQLYVTRDGLPEGAYQNFKAWDLGDIIG